VENLKNMGLSAQYLTCEFDNANVLPGCTHTNTMYLDVVYRETCALVESWNVFALTRWLDLTCWICVHRQNFKFVLHLKGEVYVDTLKGYSVAKTHRIPYLDRLFSSKEPYNWWLFCGKKPATWHAMHLRHPVVCRCEHNASTTKAQHKYMYIYI